MLINVLYFKSDWLEKFEDSEVGMFHTENSGSIEVDMMFGEKLIGYEKVGENEIIELDFYDNKTAMVIILPSNNSGKKI